MAAVSSLGQAHAATQDAQKPLPHPISQKVRSALQSNWPLYAYSALQQEIRDLQPGELKRLFDAVILDISPKEMDRLAELIPLESVENAIRTQYPQHISALQSAKALFQDAKYFLDVTGAKISPTIRTRLAGIFHALIGILESILSAFGIADFFKPSDSAVHSEFKGQKIMMLLSLFTMLSTVLLPIVGAEMVSTIIGGTLLVISTLSILYPYIKPASSKLPRAENWSQQFREGNLPVSAGRKKTLDEIARTLIASKLAKTHVMMIGKTGIGKTETAKAFVEAVERGDYPELKDKEIHYINTAELLGSTEMFSNGNKILSQISDAMGRHREHYILIFDEIHIACQKKENSVLSEQLKTLLDSGKENFPYVIGITTEEEFLREIYVNNAAFARRFKCVALENTEDAETMKILSNAFLRQAPKVFLEPNALQTLLQKTKEGRKKTSAQPANSLKILSQCIKRIESPQRSSLEARVEKLRSQVQAFRSQRAVGQGNGLSLYSNEAEGVQLENTLRQLEAAFIEQQKELAALSHDRSRLAEVKETVFQSVVRTASLGANVLTSNDKKQLNRMLLQSHCLAPMLEAKIRTAASKLGVKIILDSTLIDEVIAEEIANDRKAEAAVQRGREQLSARAAG